MAAVDPIGATRNWNFANEGSVATAWIVAERRSTSTPLTVVVMDMIELLVVVVTGWPAQDHLVRTIGRAE
ncbi:MAG: hypothetical protein L0H79_15070 [Intrasporangium sp.]|uniref:hypothetical protein n=1 Tax=Intrasporangium sp. TaxID=1925024 RepID=UPI0026499BDB|nr:hypothetical protein [Intrasporangium sp.]MDN5797062.1 hypothetical protein [Intrasporangium sp.]